MRATPNLNFTIVEPTKESLKTFVTMLRSVYQHLTDVVNGKLGFGDGTNHDNIDGSWINVVAPAAPNTDFTVTHNLGRLPVGYWPLQKDRACDVYTGSVAATSTQLTLRATVASAILRLFIVGILLGLFVSKSEAQGALHYQTAFKTVAAPGNLGIGGGIITQPIAGASITVCNGSTLPAIGSTCSGLATIYSCITLVSCTISNPTNADSNGNYVFYVSAPASYVVSVGGVGLTTYSYVLTAPYVNGSTIASSTNATNLVGPGTISGNYTISGTATFTGALNCKILENIQCVDSSLSRGGSDIGNEINLAYAALPSSGGSIYVAGGAYTYSVPIVFGVSGKIAKLVGAGVNGTFLQYTPSTGIALTLDTGTLTGNYSRLEDFSLVTTVSGSTATGLSMGPTNGVKQALVKQVYVTGFKILAQGNSLFNTYEQVRLENCSSASGSIAFNFVTPGDDDRFFGGDMAGCQTLVSVANPINGPLRAYGVDFFSGSTTTSFINLVGAGPHFICYGCHLVQGVGLGTPVYWTMNGVSQLDLIGGLIENDVTSGASTSWANMSAGLLNLSNVTISSAGATATELVLLSGTATANFSGNNISAGSAGILWNHAYNGAAITEIGTQNGSAAASLLLSGSTSGQSTLIANPTGGGVNTLPNGAGTLAATNLSQLWPSSQFFNGGLGIAGANIADSATAPTIAGAGCGGSAASIVVSNGTASFKINVGTAPGSACTVTMPTATTGWNCSASDITTNSTSVFLQKQTGAESTTSVTITNFNDVAVATAFVASDILKVACRAD